MGHAKYQSLPYLVSNIDRGPCLEELLHHNGVAFGRCNHQCSSPILCDGRGGMSY